MTMLLNLGYTLSVLSFVSMAFVAVKGDGNGKVKLDISISDTTGNDISDQFTVHHHHYNPTQQRKRDVSRPINQCPNGQYPTFQGSRCNHQFSPQDYRIWCSPLNCHYPHVVHFIGTCLPSEICVDQRDVPQFGIYGQFFGTAYCVSTSNFVDIARIELEGVAHINLPVPADKENASPNTVMAEAVLTGETNTTSMLARTMSLKAMKRDPVLRTLLNGTASCENCYNLALQPLPLDTQMLRAQVVVGEPTRGKLFLTTLSI